MTPEEIERVIEFILQSQTYAANRMDNFEAKQQEWNREFTEKLDHQRENIQGLIQMAQTLLAISQAELERMKAVEGRMGAVEGMTQSLKELVDRLKRWTPASTAMSEPRPLPDL